MASFLARCAPATGHWWAAERRTVKSYSYQWRKFREMLPHWEEVFRWSIAPIEPAFLRGKVGLDAGCGFGRSLYYAASHGAEVIGLDLSEAVEAAREADLFVLNLECCVSERGSPWPAPLAGPIITVTAPPPTPTPTSTPPARSVSWSTTQPSRWRR